MTAKNQILATAILVVALFVSYQFKGEGSISGFTGYTMGQIIFIGPLSALLAYIFLHFTKRKSGANFYSATIILTSGLILTQPLLSEVIKSKTISMQNQEIVEQSSTLSE